MKSLIRWSKGYYSKQSIWTVFLVAAFPIHVWAMMLFFWDFSWIEARSGVWNTLGVGSYGLVIALLESGLVLCVSLLFGFLIPKVFSPKERTRVLVMIILLTSGWAMLGQLYFIKAPKLTWLILPLARSARPWVVLYLAMGTIVTISVGIPIWLALQSTKFRRGLDAVMERVALLAIFYLVFDLMSIIIVVWRNNFWLPS